MNFKEFEKKIGKIESDSIHGAVYLTLELLKLLDEELETKKITQQDLEKIFIRMKKIHPEMASIKKTLANIETSLYEEEFSRENISILVKNELQNVREKEIKTIRKLAQEIKKFKEVMILSSSSTVNQALIRYKPKLAIQEIYVLESRPLFEGRATAIKLANEGYNVKLIIDAAAGFYAKKVDAIIIGADTIFPDESVINKVGSFSLALIAQHYNLPFLVGASSIKKTLTSSDNYLEFIEQKPSEEIWKNAPKIFDLKNIYFDFIPAEYITKIISEY